MPKKPTYQELEERIRELKRNESEPHDYKTIDKKSANLLSPLFEKHDSIMLLIEPDSGAIIDANIAAQKYYGYSRNALTQMKIQDINLLSSDEIAEKCHKAAIEEINNFEFPHRLSSGEIRMVEVHSSPITLNGENLLFSIVNDITNRVKAEEALQKSEEKFRILYYTTPDAVNINRLTDGLYVDVNEGFIKLTGYSREEIIGKTSLEIGIWDSPSDRQKIVQILKKDGICENLEAKFKLKNGKIITGLISANIIELSGIPHIVSVTKDISRQKQIEKEKELLISRLKTALDEVKKLSGLLPICSRCKKIRDDKGYWNQIESYIQKHSKATFSHGLCPECSDKLYEGEAWYKKMKEKKGQL